MTKYQNAVMWLGLALIFVRFLTTGQRSLFHNLLTVGGNQNLPPSGSTGNAKPTPQPNAAPKPNIQVLPKPIGSRAVNPAGIQSNTPNPRPAPGG